MRMIMMLSALALSGPALGQSLSLCYYWIDNDGTVTSYTAPPFNIETNNPISSDAGRLLIAMTERCRNDRVVRPGVTTAALEPEEPRRPPPRTMPPIPEPGPIPMPEPEVRLPVPEPTIPTPEARLPAPEPVVPTPEAELPVPDPTPEPEVSPPPPPTDGLELRLEPPDAG